jgi:alpha-glucosidase
METSAAIRPEQYDNQTVQDGNGAARLGWGALEEWRMAADGALEARLSGGRVRLQWLIDGVLRVRYYRHRDGDWTWRTTPAIERYEATSGSRVNPAGNGNDAGDGAGVTPAQAVQEVTLCAPDGWEAHLGRDGWLRVAAPDGSVVHEISTVWRETGRIAALHRATTQTLYYGLGEKTGWLDKRGERYTMWNTDVYAPHVPDVEALYVSVPFVLHAEPTNGSLAVHGLLLDNPGRTVFDFRAHDDAYVTEAETGDLDFYIVPGPQMRDVIRRYTALTGRLRLPPLWSLGYHQSRYSYMTEDEVREVAAELRRRDIPCDAIHLDIHYMDGYRVFTFDPVRFPDPAGLVADLRDQGFHVVPIVDPGVKRDPGYGTYVRGIQGGRFCKRLEGDVYIGEVWPGPSAFPDFTDAAVRAWWGEEHRVYTDAGIDGIWNDMNEPAVFNDAKTMDGDVMHACDGHPQPHREVHNLYGLSMMRATYEGMKRLLGRRPFVLTRSGYAGSGRYGAVWTGDNRSYWEHMELALPMVLNMGLSGIPFAGPDIGGFSHHATGELLARWTQMGALFPFCRNHSAIDTRRQEPWRFGPQVEAVCRAALQLRYRWLPYLYTLFEESSRTGMPVLRPLVLEYPEDTRTWRVHDEFLLGPHVLAAPVLRPGQRHRLVFLPPGRWRDVHTGEVHEGPAHIVVEAPLERMPVFVREGALLPEFPPVPCADLQRVSNLELALYGEPDGASQCFSWYEDDGASFDYETGAFNRYEAVVERTAADSAGTAAGGETVRIKLGMLHAGYTPPWREVRLRWRFAPAGEWTLDGYRLERRGTDWVARLPVEALREGVTLVFRKQTGADTLEV